MNKLFNAITQPLAQRIKETYCNYRLAEGFCKLLFPHCQVEASDFIEYCLKPAVQLRQRVRDQLALLDPDILSTPSGLWSTRSPMSAFPFCSSGVRSIMGFSYLLSRANDAILQMLRGTPVLRLLDAGTAPAPPMA